MTAPLRPAAETPSGVRIAYILRSFPRLTQTFILSEMLMLESLGVGIRVFALTNPRESVVQPEVADLRAPVLYLEEARGRNLLLLHLRVALASPLRYLRAAINVVLATEHDSGYSAHSRWRCFSFAVGVAAVLGEVRRSAEEPIDHLHAHFAHDPTLVASLVRELTGISYSFTAHARDLYQIEARALARRAAGATHVITCCGANRDYLLRELPPSMSTKVRLVHHGVDTRVFHPSSAIDGAHVAPTILAVGRLVEKKGFGDLVSACALVARRGVAFSCLVYGDGPEQARIQALIDGLGLADRVRLMGSCARSELVPMYQRADFFALTPFMTDDGDREGIPNVLLEAMASGLPALTTDVGGISEVVRHEINGLLVQPRDVGAIADGLARLLADDNLRARLGGAARRTAATDFDVRTSATELAGMFTAVGRKGWKQPA
jgi:glycosyltransferase involved in cell wall biosynthesis